MADAQRTERFQQLEERVNQRVREAVSSLQGELRERLRRAGDRVVEQLERELEGSEPELPSFLSTEELGPLADEAAAEARREARRHGLAELVAAFTAIDHSSTQTAILSALVREAGRFAGRTALFLARPQGLELWSAAGWDASLEGTVVDYADDGPWSRDALGRGASGLGSGESGRLCGRVDAPLPVAGLLVPMVLRDRLAAVLYADHGEGEELLPEALQGLTYTAALALETLPFRERSTTPTLVAPEREETGEPLGVWAAGETAASAPPAAAAPPAAGEPEPEPLPESASFGDGEEAAAGSAAGQLAGEAAGEERTTPPPPPPAGEPAGAGEDAFEAPSYDEEAASLELEPDVESEGDLYAGAGGEELTVEDAGAGGWSLEDETPPGEGPAAEVGELQVSEPEPPVDTAMGPDEDFGDEDFGDEDFGEEDFGEPGFGSDELEEGDLDLDAEGGFEEGGFEGGDELEVEPAGTGLDEAGFEADPLHAPEEEEASWSPGPADADQADAGEPGPAEDRDATADLAPPAAPAPSAPPPAPPEPPAAEPPPAADLSAGGSQVAPPSDLQGPGRAFAGGPEPSGESDARHDEARRLARLLVSEIRLYNEEEVDEGRRNNDIYERLKEDIDRSRQMYEERVDPSIREDTDYFYQELVRNLGGGDAKALGI